MSLLSALTLGFLLGMRHATDADHVVAISAIVSRERSLLAAAPIGLLWGLGHTITIVLVGGAIIVFGIVIPPRLGLSMEFSVAAMLVVLGGLTIRGVVRDARGKAAAHAHATFHQHSNDGSRKAYSVVRPLLVGTVHGLAGSAAVALLVLGAIREAWLGVAYLFVFGLGTIVGMMLITLALAMPIAVAARRMHRFHRALVVATGLASIGLGLLLACDLGFVQGLFGAQPRWMPH